MRRTLKLALAAQLIALAAQLVGCAALSESIFGYGPVQDDPQTLHESAREDIDTAELAIIERRESDPGRAATGVRKIRLLRRKYPGYGDAEDLDFLQIRGRFASENEKVGLREVKAFIESYPLRRESEIKALLFDMGSYLMLEQASGRIFVNEKELGADLLRFLAMEMPPDRELVPAAWRQLGWYYYFELQDYGEALFAFASIAKSEGPNPWSDLARLMIPLCLLRSIYGPDYDAAALWHADKQGYIYPGENGLMATARLLRDYLQGAIPGQQTIRAQAALELVERMLAQREEGTAEFYRAVGHESAMREHENLAAQHWTEVARLESLLAPFREQSGGEITLEPGAPLDTDSNSGDQP